MNAQAMIAMTSISEMLAITEKINELGVSLSKHTTQKENAEQAAETMSLTTVIETVGTSLLSFLEPRELFLLSTSSRCYHQKVVHQFVFATCSKHLSTPIGISDDKNYVLEFDTGRSFYDKIEPWEVILSQVIVSAGLLDIFRRAYDTEKFTTCEALYLEKDRPETKDEGTRNETLVTVLCNLHDDNANVAHGIARYIMNRDAIRNGRGRERYGFVWDWVDYLIRLKGVSIEYWEWDINKRKYREFGKGLVFVSEEVGEEVELKLTASAVPLFQWD